MTVEANVDAWGYSVYSPVLRHLDAVAQVSISATKTGTEYFLRVELGTSMTEIVVNDDEMREFFRAYLFARQEHVADGRLSDN